MPASVNYRAMTLREYMDSLDSIKNWCKANRLNQSLVTQVASKVTKRIPGPMMAKKICKATGGLVPLSSLRPDIWG